MLNVLIVNDSICSFTSIFFSHSFFKNIFLNSDVNVRYSSPTEKEAGWWWWGRGELNIILRYAHVTIVNYNNNNNIFGLNTSI